jgi:xylulokinase
MHGATLLEADGKVLRPCILWNDQRSGAECDWITGRVGLDHLLRWVGNPALAGFTVPKLLWVRNNEPEVYARVASVLLPKDYLNYLLTGVQATDYSDASGTLLFDIGSRQWSSDLAEALDLPLRIFPRAFESSAVIGRITPEAGAATGLAVGTPVVAGGADNACAAVAMGVLQPGQVLASIGTSGTLVAPMNEPRVDAAGRMHTFCHAVPDTWYSMGVVLSAGGSLRWLRDVLGEPDYAAMMEAAARVRPGSDGLIFLPYLTGERTPHGDPDARGAFFGLSLRHGPGHLTRSVVEGVCFALADSADIMRSLGVCLQNVHATGGGARSPLWRTVLASALRSTVVEAAEDGGPAWGAAILAGVGSGIWESVQQGSQRLLHLGDATDPDPALSSAYRPYHRLYDALYPRLADSYRELAQIEAANQVP